jgi:undecaprenyl-diphosphatase
MVGSGLTLDLDNFISKYFKSIQGSQSVDAVMIIITSFGDVFTLFIAGIILTIIRRTRKMGMVFLFAIVILAILIMYIKPLIGRTIPIYKFEPALQLPENFVIEYDTPTPFSQNLSYPSNHVALATAFAFIVGFGLNQKSRTAGLLIWSFPVIIAVTRMYIMQHYLTDVISGFVLGLIISVILSKLMSLSQPFSMSRFKGKEDTTKTH